jgi:hypothetical protein
MGICSIVICAGVTELSRWYAGFALLCGKMRDGEWDGMGKSDENYLFLPLSGYIITCEEKFMIYILRK